METTAQQMTSRKFELFLVSKCPTSHMTYEAICILNIKVSGIHMNPDFGYLVFGLLLYYTTTAE